PFQPAFVELSRERREIGWLLTAIRRIAAGDCNSAVVTAVDGPAVVLADPRILPVRTYAQLLCAVTSGRGTAELQLLDVCADCGVAPTSITLLCLAGADGRAERLDALRKVFSRGPQRLPHCAIGPPFGAMLAEGLESLCGAALAVYERL